jgi:hypothetical protein
MKFHQGGGVFAYDDVPIPRIVREWNAFNKARGQHYKFLAALQGKRI